MVDLIAFEITITAHLESVAMFESTSEQRSRNSSLKVMDK